MMKLRLCLLMICTLWCVHTSGQTYDRQVLLTKLPVLKSRDTTHFTVFVFLSPECPLCKNYSVVLNGLYQHYAGQVRFVGIVPGKTYSRKVIRKFRRAYHLSFDIYQDPEKAVSNYLAATVTPEVLLLNEGGMALYRGSIDNWVVNLGKKRQAATAHYLDDAIRQGIQQQPVALSYMPPIGCYINDF
jgi:thiol-disulfide isomerase/thioredoxin